MKTLIKPEDIRKDDLIRVEDDEENAWEYRAPSQGFTLAAGRYYILDRPKPPFEPYWGMVIGDPSDATRRAVYIPENTEESHLGWMISDKNIYMGNDWAKRKLAQGWAVIEKPEDVK